MRWPWQRKTTSAELVLGIELHQQQTFAVVRNAHGVIACYRPAVDEQGTAGLEAWLRAHQWQHLDTTLSLDPQDYETHLIEAPNVADDELNDAVRFRMKDVLSQPVEQCVLQTFRLADDAYRGRSSMAMVVATRRDWVQQWVHWCEQQCLNLQAITIAELSLLHIVGQLEPETSVGVLRLNGSDSVLYVYQNGSLYLTRKLEVGADALTPMANDGAFELVNDPQFDRLTLEMQRSLDYFESQLGVGAIGQVWVLLPDHQPDDSRLVELEQVLNLPVRTLSLETQFNHSEDGLPLTASLVTALGASLSYELDD
ncbi:MAG: hypothetical protein IBX52_03370 [Bacterioplanes sp.]|nr:hypothetical protein [Bacterioplanes sp.]